jgi:serine/threonine protein kinase
MNEGWVVTPATIHTTADANYDPRVSVDPAAATVPAPSALAALAPGDLVGERYRVEAVIGRGATGVVYRVEHVYMRKRFALKVLDCAFARTPGALARFEREAIATGNICDPHIAHATDFGRLPDDSCFLVLEYIDGQTLRSVLEGGALKPRRALAIARGIVSAIEAAHAAGVIHRDLKPENIMLLDRDGDPDYVKVLDFGIAALEPSAIASASPQVITQLGALIGTPYYMAPEQATGERIDARTDLYAVGIILFEMLTGDCPFRGDAVSVIRQHVLQQAPALPPSVHTEVGEAVVGVVRRLLAKKPEERLGSARELALALDECLGAFTTCKGAPVFVPTELTPAASRVDVHRTLAPLGQVYRRTTASMLAWRTAALEVVRARRRRRRIQAAFAWPGELVVRLRSWTHRRRNSVADLPAAVATRVRRSFPHLRFQVTGRNLALLTAIGLAVLVFAIGWRSAHSEDAMPSSSHGSGSSSTVAATHSTGRSPAASHPTAKSVPTRQ